MPAPGRAWVSGSQPDGIDAAARAYATTRDAALREALVRRCATLVTGIAAEYRTAEAGQGADLVQVGFVGLLTAIEHYDPARGTPFLVYARHFVRGEIRHYLRDHHNVVRRPRWLDRLNGQIAQAIGGHVAEHGRYPGLSDLAARLSLDEAALTEILTTGEVVRTLSLDAQDGDGEPTVDLAAARPVGGRWLTPPPEDRIVLIEALEALNPMQRAVVFYTYFTDLTQGEAAARIGVSQKHVSRLLASALRRLRDLLMPEPPGR